MGARRRARVRLQSRSINENALGRAEHRFMSVFLHCVAGLRNTIATSTPRVRVLARRHLSLRLGEGTRVQAQYVRRVHSENSQREAAQKARLERLRKPVVWGAAVVVGVFGLSYLAVPLYKIFCSVTGENLKKQEESIEKLKEMRPPAERESRIITVSFHASTNDKLQWSFRPCQSQIKVIPGKSSLAFYNATNKADKAIVGMATYNVAPLAAGKYFNKIQCFCFEEQRLKAGEDIDMPVFFLPRSGALRRQTHGWCAAHHTLLHVL